MKRLEILIAILTLTTFFTSVLFFLQASSELEIKKFFAKNTGLFQSYVPVSECSAEERGSKFNQGVFNIGTNQSYDLYESREDSMLVFSLKDRNVYTSIDRMKSGLPSDSAREGDQFYVLEVGTTPCSKGHYSFVKGVLHKR